MPDPEYPTSIRQAEIRDDFKSGNRYREWLAKVKPEKLEESKPSSERMIPIILRRRAEAPQPDLKSLIPRIAAALAKCPAPDFRSPCGSICFLVEPEDDVRTWHEDHLAPPAVYAASRKSMVVEGRRYCCWYGEFHGVKLFGPMFPV